jgi:hypothetical protein
VRQTNTSVNTPTLTVASEFLGAHAPGPEDDVLRGGPRRPRHDVAHADDASRAISDRRGADREDDGVRGREQDPNPKAAMTSSTTVAGDMD